MVPSGYHYCIVLRGDEDLRVEVQHILITLRGDKYLPMEVYYILVALRGGRDPLVEVQLCMLPWEVTRILLSCGGPTYSQCLERRQWSFRGSPTIYIALKGANGTLVEVEHILIALSGDKDFPMKFQLCIFPWEAWRIFLWKSITFLLR